MAETIVQFGVDIDNRKMVDLNNAGNKPQFKDIMRLFGGEEPVLAGSFVNRSLTAIAFESGDAFELNLDNDFQYNEYNGTTNAAYTGAVTSLAGTFADDISDIPDAGYITLRNDNGDRESVEYSAKVVTGSGPYVGTFTVNKTLTNSYDSGDVISVQDQLMAHADNDDVNISGDWTESDKTAGKLSFRLNCGSYSFLTKIQEKIAELSDGQQPDVPVYIEIKRFPAGGTTPPVTLLQDVVFARPSVRDVEGYTVPTGPDWTLADARYVRGVASLTTQYRMTYVDSGGVIAESSSIVTTADGNLGIGGAGGAERISIRESASYSAVVRLEDSDGSLHAIIGTARQSDDIVTGSVDLDLCMINRWNVSTIFGNNGAENMRLKGGVLIVNETSAVGGEIARFNGDVYIDDALTVGGLKAGQAAKSADYIILDDDNLYSIFVTTGATDRTITLPTAADNDGRLLNIKKVDIGAASVIIDGEGSETIDGALTITISSQFDSVSLQCDGTEWFII